MKRIIIHIDGASQGNPGPAAIGVVISDPRGSILETRGEAIGRATNNQAEYRALLRGLERAAALGAEELDIRTDSELLARQMNGEYRVRDMKLKTLYHQAQRAQTQFSGVSIRHISRWENQKADELAGRALI